MWRPTPRRVRTIVKDCSETLACVRLLSVQTEGHASHTNLSSAIRIITTTLPRDTPRGRGGLTLVNDVVVVAASGRDHHARRRVQHHALASGGVLVVVGAGVAAATPRGTLVRRAGVGGAAGELPLWAVAAELLLQLVLLLVELLAEVGLLVGLVERDGGASDAFRERLPLLALLARSARRRYSRHGVVHFLRRSRRCHCPISLLFLVVVRINFVHQFLKLQ